MAITSNRIMDTNIYEDTPSSFYAVSFIFQIIVYTGVVYIQID